MNKLKIMKKNNPKKGMALLLVMGVIVVVLTTISIGVTLYLNNIDANRGKDDSNQSLQAAQAGIEKARALFKQDAGFFGGCQVNDCINFSGSTCVDCSNSAATVTDSQQRYRYKVKITTLNPDGATLQSTGYKGLYNRVVNSGLSFYKPFSCGDQIEDGEGNKYSTVAIDVEADTQCWMATNLKTKEFPDGSCINGETAPCPDASGDDAAKGRACRDNDESACNDEGAFYELAAAMNGGTSEGERGICPADWHIPTNDDWFALEDAFRGNKVECDPNRNKIECENAGLELQSGGSSGFESRLPGYRLEDEKNFDFSKAEAVYWSSSLIGSSTKAWVRRFLADEGGIDRAQYEEKFAVSVRCIKD